jgi:hypothetical protein
MTSVCIYSRELTRIAKKSVHNAVAWSKVRILHGSVEIPSNPFYKPRPDMLALLRSILTLVPSQLVEEANQTQRAPTGKII